MWIRWFLSEGRGCKPSSAWDLGSSDPIPMRAPAQLCLVGPFPSTTPLPAMQLKCSQTSEHADPKRCCLVTALLCWELPPGKALPLPPFLGGHRGVVAAGRCPCTFGARLGVFGHMPGIACMEQGSAGGCTQAAAMCRASSRPRGVASSTPMSPSACSNAPLLLFWMQPVPLTPVGPERGSAG